MGSGADDTSSGDDAGGDDLGLPISRRTLLRIVIVLAIGIPIVLEGLTFVGLVGNQLADGDGSPGDGATTPDGDDLREVGVGEDLLAATDQPELLQSATVRPHEGWEFTLTANVTNTGTDSYRFAITSVTTKNGRTIDEIQSTTTLAAGEGTSFVGVWDMPDGDIPDRVTVEATVQGADGSRTVTETVVLATVEIQG